MIYSPWIIAIFEVLVVTLPVLFAVAFVTVAERKTMASMQRRVGPNMVGYYGLLQAFADALKLLLKEYVSPTQANLILFFLGPIITLIFALLGFLVVPFAPGLAVSDFDLGLLYMLAVSSIATYGILLAGWSANSKYAFLGSLRSTAQLISYELVLTSALLIVVFLTNSLNLSVNIEAQRPVWFIFPLFPVFLIFFIGSVAETNRAPFDLAEAESELVSGFMTEHSAVIFVFFFLAEYASIVLMCILISVLFLGGYHLDYALIGYLGDYIAWNFQDIMYISIENLHYSWNDSLAWWMDTNLEYLLYTKLNISLSDYFSDNGYFENIDVESLELHDYYTHPSRENLMNALVIGGKSALLIFIFIWVRASYPRIRFDNLMSFCWTVLLPLIFAFILLIPCIMYIFNIVPTNVLFF